MARKYWPFSLPNSNTWAMLAWDSRDEILASSMNMVVNSSSSLAQGRIRLMATIFSKPLTPAALVRKTSAMPPVLSLFTITYWPNFWGFSTRIC